MIRRQEKHRPRGFEGNCMRVPRRKQNRWRLAAVDAAAAVVGGLSANSSNRQRLAAMGGQQIKPHDKR